MILETLYLIDIQAIGGERGIRTLDGLLTHTPLAGERFRPLSQLSEIESSSLEYSRTFNYISFRIKVTII